MRILYVCDRLITFILNEIIELKKMGNDVYILPNRHDAWVDSHVIQPILSENGLLDKIFLRRAVYNNKKQKLIHLFFTILCDFFQHPLLTMRWLYNMFKVYSEMGYGTECYLDTRQFFATTFDVIHSPFSTPQILDKVYFISKSLNIPYTLSFRAHDIYIDKAQREKQKRLHIINEASHIITISSFNKHFLEEKLNINKNIDIIHGSINSEFFTPAEHPRSIGSIIAICRLDEQKGLIYLLEACHILHQRNIKYKCTIIGEGPEKAECQRIIDQLKIPNIDLIGFVTQDEIKDYLNRSIVCVLPCVTGSDGRRDILPNSLKEAMSMEVPVITSKINGIEELVDDGINGILIPPKDPKAITDAITMIFSNPDLRNRMGKEARKKIQKDFDVKIEAKKLEAIFKTAALPPMASQ
jgi:glycosyltransferase involved in cell wall biosynthesis